MKRSNTGPAPPSTSEPQICPRCGSRLHAFGKEQICINCSQTGIAIPVPEQRQPLSHREQQVVDLVCRAKTNKEIAHELSLTEGTVKEYLHHIFRKLKVSNRTELALSRFESSAPGLTGRVGS